jgi:hypothetical protein
MCVAIHLTTAIRSRECAKKRPITSQAYSAGAMEPPGKATPYAAHVCGDADYSYAAILNVTDSQMEAAT